MRIRTIKPEFWTDEPLSELPYDTRLLAIALLNLADDEGYFLANAMLVKSACFPFLESSKSIPRMLQELSSVGFIRLGKTECGKDLGHVINFLKHQRVDKPKPSNLRKKSRFQDESKTNPIMIQDSSKEEWKGMEQGMEQGMEKGREKEQGNSRMSDGFEKFWNLYPKKIDRNGTLRSWKKVKDSELDEIFKALEICIESDQWQKNAGQFIPNPTTWINQRRWESVVELPDDRNSWRAIENRIMEQFEADNALKRGLNPQNCVLEVKTHG